ncbi:MAG: MarR family transcriptional regulator [Gaiellaceae bacterium]|jgi:DNA-binding MarR family transcriptional regulator|nr:MAG: MarR family transcriptional regulator [Gaiellaceae bacterium]
MPRQALTQQASSSDAFAGLLHAYARATRRLNALLLAEHDLTLSDYEVLLRLARAPGRRLRRVDLAEQVLLTASGITRLLDGLEAAGYVERGSCDTDRRVVYAVLTDAGLEKIRAAQRSHVAQVAELFAERLDQEETAELATLLRKLGRGAADDDCDAAI